MQQELEQVTDTSLESEKVTQTKEKLSQSLAGLEAAVQQYHKRQQMQKEQIMDELDMYIKQLKVLIEEEEE